MMKNSHNALTFREKCDIIIIPIQKTLTKRVDGMLFSREPRHVLEARYYGNADKVVFIEIAPYIQALF